MVNRYISIILSLLLLLCTYSSYGQRNTETFKIPLPDKHISNSLYDSIYLMDIRKDTTNFGIIQKGFFNRKTNVVAKTPLKIQLSKVLKALVGGSAEKGKLLLLLRQCRFAEVSKMSSESGYFHLRAILFSQKNQKYKKISAIDTVVMVKSIVDVTKSMLRSGYQTFEDFITDNLKRKPSSDLTLTKVQLNKIDRIEKRNLRLYIVDNYTNGVYDNFHSFLDQHPDETNLSASFDNEGSLRRVFYKNKEGKDEKVKKKSVYAIVYKNKPYIVTKYGYYPLKKRGNDFYFTGKISSYTTGDVVTAEIFFGIVGGLLAQTATSLFEMKLDHLSGGFIKIKAVNE